MHPRRCGVPTPDGLQVARALPRREAERPLEDRSSAPRRWPHRLDSDVVNVIVAARREILQGPHRLAYALGPQAIRHLRSPEPSGGLSAQLHRAPHPNGGAMNEIAPTSSSMSTSRN